MSDLTIKRGDNRSISLAITDPAGIGADPNDPTTWPPLNLTGCELWFYVKADTDDPDSAAVIQKSTGSGITVTDVLLGLATVSIDPIDTVDLPKKYLNVDLLYEVQVQDATNKIITVADGTIEIEADIVIAPDDAIPAPGSTFTYDPTTSEGRIRLLCQDFDPREMIFSDAEITAFSEMTDGNILYAAAMALEVIAANEVYVQKRIKILDLWTDGPREAEQLMKLAAGLREQATMLAPADDMFDWAEMVVDTFSLRERMWKDAMRESS